MNKLVIFLSVLFFASFSVNDQSGNKIFIKTHIELIEIASEYVERNPDDIKADSLLQNSLFIKSEYTSLLDKRTAGMYSSTRDILELIRLESEANTSDPKANGYSKAFVNSFKANNAYFPTVSSQYKNVLSEGILKAKKMKSKKKKMKNKKKKKN